MAQISTKITRRSGSVLDGTQHAEDGARLDKSSLDSAWQRLIHRAIKRGVIAADQRFGLHDLKRKGVTDTAGTRADKQDASGHKTASMMDVYDLSVPVVQPSVT